MKTNKRTWLKTALLSLIRYERWKMNPRNWKAVAFMEMHASRWMLVLAVVVIAGCTSHRKITETTKQKTNLTEQVDTHADINLTSKTATDIQQKNEGSKAKETKQSENSQKKTIHTVFDTDKPADPKTGRHPIKEQTVTETNNKSESESRELEQTRAELAILINENWKLKAELDSMKKVKDKTVTNTEYVEKWGVSWYWWLIAGICVTVGIWIVWKIK